MAMTDNVEMSVSGGMHDDFSSLDGDIHMVGGAYSSDEDEASNMNRIMIDLERYSNSMSAHVKDQLIKKIGMAVKRLGGQVNMRNQETIIESIKKHLPGRGSGRIVATSPKLISISKAIGNVINEVFGARRGSKIIDVDQSANRLIRDVTEYIYNLGCNSNTEFLRVYRNISTNLEKMDALSVIMDEMFDKKRNKINQIIDGTEDPRVERSFDEIEITIKDSMAMLKRYINELRSIVGILARDKDSLQLEFDALKDARELMDNFTEHALDDDEEFSHFVSKSLESLGNTAVVTAVVNKALNKVGLSLKEYKNAPDIKKLMMDINSKVKRLDPHRDAKKIGTILQYSQELIANFGKRKRIKGGGIDGSGCGCNSRDEFDIMSEIEGGASELDDNVDFDDDGDDASYESIEGGARTKRTTEEIKYQAKVHRVQLAVKMYAEELNKDITKFTNSIVAAAPHLGRAIFETDKVEKVINDISYIENLRKPEIYLAMAGLKVSDSSSLYIRERKDKMLRLIKTMGEIGAKYPAAKKDLLEASHAVRSILERVDWFSDLIGTLIRHLSGKVKLDKLVKDVPFMVFSTDIAKKRLYHALNIAQMRNSMKQSAKDLDKYSEKYTDLLAFSVGERRRKIDDERNILLACDDAAADEAGRPLPAGELQEKLRDGSVDYAFRKGYKSAHYWDTDTDRFVPAGAVVGPGLIQLDIDIAAVRRTANVAAATAAINTIPAGPMFNNAAILLEAVKTPAQRDVINKMLNDREEKSHIFTKFRKEVEDEFRAKHRLYKAMESLDIILSAFAKELVNDSELVREVKKYLDDTKVYTRWFTDYTGNMLAAVFESMPAYIDLNNFPLPGPVGAAARGGIPAMNTIPPPLSTTRLDITAGMMPGTPVYSGLAASLESSSETSFYYKHLMDKSRDAIDPLFYGKATGVVDMDHSEATRGYIDKFYNNFQALKNLFHSFITLHNSVVSRTDKLASIMSPSQIYYSILTYLKQSCLARKKPISNSAAVGIPQRSTWETKFAGLILPAYYPKPPLPVAGAAVPQSLLGYYRQKIDEHYASVYETEDRLCAMGIKSTVSAVLSVLGMYYVSKQPVSLGIARTVRSISGGAGLLSGSLYGDLYMVERPTINPAAMETYFYITRLLEFYKELFSRIKCDLQEGDGPGDRKPKTRNHIRMPVDLKGEFGKLIFVVNENARPYEENTLRIIISEINSLYSKYKSTMEVVNALVREVNRRFSLIVDNETYKQTRILESRLQEVNWDETEDFTDKINRITGSIEFEGESSTDREARLLDDVPTPSDSIGKTLSKYVNACGNDDVFNRASDDRYYGKARAEAKYKLDENMTLYLKLRRMRVILDEMFDEVLKDKESGEYLKSYDKFNRDTYKGFLEDFKSRLTGPNADKYAIVKDLINKNAPPISKDKLRLGNLDTSLLFIETGGVLIDSIQKTRVLVSTLIQDISVWSGDAFLVTHYEATDSLADSTLAYRMLRYGFGKWTKKLYQKSAGDTEKHKQGGWLNPNQPPFDIYMEDIAPGALNNLLQQAYADAAAAPIGALFIAGAALENVKLLPTSKRLVEILEALKNTAIPAVGGVGALVQGNYPANMEEVFNKAWAAAIAAGGVPAIAIAGVAVALNERIIAAIIVFMLKRDSERNLNSNITSFKDFIERDNDDDIKNIANHYKLYHLIISILLKKMGGLRLLGIGYDYKYNGPPLPGVAANGANIINASILNLFDGDAFGAPHTIALKQIYGIQSLLEGNTKDRGTLKMMRAQYIKTMFNECLKRFELSTVFTAMLGTMNRLVSSMGNMINATIATEGTSVDLTRYHSLMRELINKARHYIDNFADYLKPEFVKEIRDKNTDNMQKSISIYSSEYETEKLFEAHIVNGIRVSPVIDSANYALTSVHRAIVAGSDNDKDENITIKQLDLLPDMRVGTFGQLEAMQWNLLVVPYSYGGNTFINALMPTHTECTEVNVKKIYSLNQMPLYDILIGLGGTNTTPTLMRNILANMTVSAGPGAPPGPAAVPANVNLTAARNLFVMETFSSLENSSALIPALNYGIRQLITSFFDTGTRKIYKEFLGFMFNTKLINNIQDLRTTYPDIFNGNAPAPGIIPDMFTKKRVHYPMPSEDAFLTTSVAALINSLFTTMNTRTQVPEYLLDSLASFRNLAIVDSIKLKLPMLKEYFLRLINKCKILRGFLTKGCGTRARKKEMVRTVLPFIRLIDGNLDGVSTIDDMPYIENATTEYPNATFGDKAAIYGATQRDPILRNRAPGGAAAPGVKKRLESVIGTGFIDDQNFYSMSVEKTYAYFMDKITDIEDICIEVVKVCDSILKEYSDDDKFMIPESNFYEKHARLFPNQTPYTPLSMLTAFTSVSPQYYDLHSMSNSLGSTNFKLQFGARGVIYSDSSRVFSEKYLEGALDVFNKANAGSNVKISQSDYMALIKQLITLIRFNFSLIDYSEMSVVPGGNYASTTFTGGAGIDDYQGNYASTTFTGGAGINEYQVMRHIETAYNHAPEYRYIADNNTGQDILPNAIFIKQNQLTNIASFSENEYTMQSLSNPTDGNVFGLWIVEWFWNLINGNLKSSTTSIKEENIKELNKLIYEKYQINNIRNLRYLYSDICRYILINDLHKKSHNLRALYQELMKLLVEAVNKGYKSYNRIGNIIPVSTRQKLVEVERQYYTAVPVGAPVDALFGPPRFGTIDTIVCRDDKLDIKKYINSVYPPNRQTFARNDSNVAQVASVPHINLTFDGSFDALSLETLVIHTTTEIAAETLYLTVAKTAVDKVGATMNAAVVQEMRGIGANGAAAAAAGVKIADNMYKIIEWLIAESTAAAAAGAGLPSTDSIALGSADFNNNAPAQYRVALNNASITIGNPSPANLMTVNSLLGVNSIDLTATAAGIATNDRLTPLGAAIPNSSPLNDVFSLLYPAPVAGTAIGAATVANLTAVLGAPFTNQEINAIANVLNSGPGALALGALINTLAPAMYQMYVDITTACLMYNSTILSLFNAIQPQQDISNDVQNIFSKIVTTININDETLSILLSNCLKFGDGTNAGNAINPPRDGESIEYRVLLARLIRRDIHLNRLLVAQNQELVVYFNALDNVMPQTNPGNELIAPANPGIAGASLVTANQLRLPKVTGNNNYITPNSLIDQKIRNSKFIYRLRAGERALPGMLNSDIYTNAQRMQHMGGMNPFANITGGAIVNPENKYSLLKYIRDNSDPVTFMYTATNSALEPATLIDMINGDNDSEFKTLIAKSLNEVDLDELCKDSSYTDPTSILRNTIPILIELGINPINVHAMQRFIPFANIYNYSYTLDRFVYTTYNIKKPWQDVVDSVLASDCGSRKQQITLQNLLKGGINTMPQQLDLPREVFVRLIIDPYAEVDTVMYGMKVNGPAGGVAATDEQNNHKFFAIAPIARILRGYDYTGMGMPKFLSDQVLNKALLDSLYINQRNMPLGVGRNIALMSPTRRNIPILDEDQTVLGEDIGIEHGNMYMQRFLREVDPANLTNVANYLSFYDNKIKRHKIYDLTQLFAPSLPAGGIGATNVVLEQKESIKEFHREGYERFNTQLIRNVVLIANLQRFMRYSINSWLSKAYKLVEHSHKAVAREITEFDDGNEQWKADPETYEASNYF